MKVRNLGAVGLNSGELDFKPVLQQSGCKANDDLHTPATLTGVVVPPELQREGGSEKMIIILN